MFGGMPPPQHARQRRVSLARVTALSAAVVLSAVLPLTAASAGPVSDPAEARKAEKSSSARGVESMDGKPAGEPLRGPLKPPTGSVEERLSAPDDSAALSGVRGGSDDRPSASGPSAVCGPQVAVRGRVTAQTCVLEEEDLTWGRTYYRNISGTQLWGVLTLLGPDGRTLQVNCELPPSGNPASCETPQERTVRPLEHEEPYMAVAEIASADGEQMLLRSGSNAPEDQLS